MSCHAPAASSEDESVVDSDEAEEGCNDDDDGHHDLDNVRLLVCSCDRFTSTRERG